MEKRVLKMISERSSRSEFRGDIPSHWPISCFNRFNRGFARFFLLLSDCVLGFYYSYLIRFFTFILDFARIRLKQLSFFLWLNE